MYDHVMVETLSGTFNAIFLGGVTYITCCYTLTLPLSEGLHLLFCVLYNVVSENHSVQNSPWGGGGSIASSRPIKIGFTVFVVK